MKVEVHEEYTSEERKLKIVCYYNLDNKSSLLSSLNQSWERE